MRTPARAVAALVAAAAAAACGAKAPARTNPPAPRAEAPAPPAPPALSLPAASATPAPAAVYRIGPGDVLEILVLGNADLSRSATVQPSGTIGLPLLGDVPVSGLTPSEAQKKLTTLLARDFLVNPQVEVRVKEYQSQFVLVLGEVNQPGRKPLRGSSRLIDILVEAGGFSARASGEVVITRGEGELPGGGRTMRIRLGGAFSAQEYVTLEMPLRHGDVVTALARSYVTVEGEVQRPNRYPIEGDLTVSGAISMAGGLTRYGSNDVRLRRIDPATGKVTITEVDLGAVRRGRAPDPPVSGNDVITVPRRLF